MRRDARIGASLLRVADVSGGCYAASASGFGARERRSHLGPALLHGISTCRRVPPPAGLSTASVPSSAATRSPSPRRPEPRRRVGAADAVVGDLDDHAPVGAPHRDLGLRRLGVLRHVRERLGDDEVGGALDRRREGARRRRPRASTGTGARATSDSSAGSSPRSVSTAGWMPRASSRSSARLVCSSSCARSSSAGELVVVARARGARGRSSSARPTSRDCAPSWRSRSSRRRSASPASTSRARDARSSSRRACSSASSCETWLRSRPPRKANGQQRGRDERGPPGGVAGAGLGGRHEQERQQRADVDRRELEPLERPASRASAATSRTSTRTKSTT